MINKKIGLFVLILAFALPLAFAGTVDRTISPMSVAGGAEVTVTLGIHADAADTFYTIEEIYPAGWTVTDSGNLGTGDAGKLKVAVVEELVAMSVPGFEITSTAYEYKLQAPATFTVGDFTGEFFFNDEVAHVIGGHNQVTFSETPPLTGCAAVPAECLSRAECNGAGNVWNLVGKTTLGGGECLAVCPAGSVDVPVDANTRYCISQACMDDFALCILPETCNGAEHQWNDVTGVCESATPVCSADNLGACITAGICRDATDVLYWHIADGECYVTCPEGTEGDSTTSMCVSATPPPPTCSVDNLGACDTEPKCHALGNNYNLIDTVCTLVVTKVCTDTDGNNPAVVNTASGYIFGTDQATTVTDGCYVTATVDEIIAAGEGAGCFGVKCYSVKPVANCEGEDCQAIEGVCLGDDGSVTGKKYFCDSCNAGVCKETAPGGDCPVINVADATLKGLLENIHGILTSGQSTLVKISKIASALSNYGGW